VADCLPLVQHLLNKTEIGVVKEDQASRLVLMNRTELQQVVINLIVNAIHAMPDGGSLTLRSYDADRDRVPGIVIEVADTGIGIDADVVEKVFDPLLYNETSGWNRPWSFHKPRHLIKRQRRRKSPPKAIGRGRYSRSGFQRPTDPNLLDLCPAKSGHFVLGASAVTHKSMISCIVRLAHGIWLTPSSNNLKGRSDDRGAQSR
jgi:hypothetical protein